MVCVTEVTPAECIPLPAPSITALPGRLQPPPPLGHRPWPRSCVEQLSTRCTAPRILFPGKRGRETARCSFPCISMGRMVGANAGQEFSQTQARHPGRWLLRGLRSTLAALLPLPALLRQPTKRMRLLRRWHRRAQQPT